MGLEPYAYLYNNSPYCVYSAFFVEENVVKNELDYLSVFPEKKPEVVYFPVETGDKEKKSIMIFNEEGRTEEEFEGLPKEEYRDFGLFEGRAIKGKAGLIVKVAKWREIEKR